VSGCANQQSSTLCFSFSYSAPSCSRTEQAVNRPRARPAFLAAIDYKSFALALLGGVANPKHDKQKKQRDSSSS